MRKFSTANIVTLGAASVAAALHVWLNGGGWSPTVHGMPVLLLVLTFLGVFQQAPQPSDTSATPPTPPTGLSMLAVMAMVLSMTGCSPSQATQVVATLPADVATIACVITTTAQDVAAGMSPPAVVADDIAKCGADATSIATVLDAQAKAEAVVTGGDASKLPAYAAKLSAVSAAARGGADAGHD